MLRCWTLEYLRAKQKGETKEMKQKGEDVDVEEANFLRRWTSRRCRRLQIAEVQMALPWAF